MPAIQARSVAAGVVARHSLFWRCTTAYRKPAAPEMRPLGQEKEQPPFNWDRQPLDHDVPLSEGIRLANERYRSPQTITEDEVVAGAQASWHENPETNNDAYITYLKVVKDRVFPKGMYFRRTSNLGSTSVGNFQVDWRDLCIEGRIPTAQEKEEFLAKYLPGAKAEEVRIGGFSYRIRARFVSPTYHGRD